MAKSFSNTSKKNSKKTKASSSIVNGVKSIIKNLISLAGKGISRLFPSEILMYSPNLNPIERLWKVMNEQVRNNRFFKSAKDFRSEINRFFEEILPGIGDSLSSRINDNFQLL